MSGRVLIAAGGTGGHIFPAVALGEALQQYYPEVEVRFACGERELEKKLFADVGIDPIIFPARQLGSGLAGKLGGILAAGGNTMSARRFVRKERFDVVVGMGGYVSGPTVLGGILAGRPTVIHEANSIPGKTNRILAPFARLTALHFPITAEHLEARRTAVVGMPLRSTVANGSRDEALREFGLAGERRTLIVLGGSQGAKFLYHTLLDSLPALDTPAHSDVQILWSTGAANYEELNSRLSGMRLHHLQVKLLPFIARMDLALALADAAVARAGASTMAELLACGVYALYVPFPSAIYDHQTLNARQAVGLGLGRMVTEKELTPARAAEEIAALLAETELERRLEVPEEMDSRHAAKRLADEVVALVQTRRS